MFLVINYFTGMQENQLISGSFVERLTPKGKEEVDHEAMDGCNARSRKRDE